MLRLSTSRKISQAASYSHKLNHINCEPHAFRVRLAHMLDSLARVSRRAGHARMHIVALLHILVSVLLDLNQASGTTCYTTPSAVQTRCASVSTTKLADTHTQKHSRVSHAFHRPLKMSITLTRVACAMFSQVTNVRYQHVGEM